MTKKKIAMMFDSESLGLSEAEARARGYYYVPIKFYIDGKEGDSGIDYTLEWVYDNLGSETEFKTSTSSIESIIEEFNKALEDAEHILYVPLTKHFTSQANAARNAAIEAGLEDKVTIYDSEFISPWIIAMEEEIHSLVQKDASLEEFMALFDKTRGNMFAWLFPNNLERLKASGRLSKAAYMAGTLLKITPVTPVINGMLDPNGVIKARSKDKALDKIVENTIEKFEELKSKGLNPIILIAVLGRAEDNEHLELLRAKFLEKGIADVPLTWISAAVVGHVGLGGIGAGVAIK